MSTKLTLILSISLVVIGTLVGVLLWQQFPEQMASHWNAQDQVDGTISRFWGVFLMPLVCAALLLLFLVIPQIDPLKKNIAAFRGTFNLFIVFILGFMVYVHLLTLVYNLGYHFAMSKALLPAMGGLVYLAGELIAKAKRNWFIGIRTPWTLSSDSVWAQTHKLGAILFKACAVLIVIGALLGGAWTWLGFAPILASALFLVVYSYVLYRRETSSG
jgi:uncharacterized membrane protein